MQGDFREMGCRKARHTVFVPIPTPALTEATWISALSANGPVNVAGTGRSLPSSVSSTFPLPNLFTTALLKETGTPFPGKENFAS